ncbi:primosomal protein N' [Enemella sp. A6]|uniref:primosomal protein N' n=1 Tax=Enemella sp. A6 TaxID=3440152 RepID=UPI003EB74D19
MDALVDAGTTRIARVAVDVPLPHLDRLFDYRLTDEQAEVARVGCRVRVRFSGRLVDGYILDLPTDSDHQGSLSGIHAVVSSESVLTAEVAHLVRAVADHYAGTFADVVRLAVPPRHAKTEKATPALRPPVDLTAAAAHPNPLSAYPTGEGLLQALAEGGVPRAAWQAAPTADPIGDLDRGLVACAVATMQSGRGALIVVPDNRDVARMAAICDEVVGPSGYVRLTADLGPAARYRAFLAALRGDVQLVIGTRAAAFAPVPNLGFLGLLDDGDDLHAEPRAPYPHAREVLALRAGLAPAALVIGARTRTTEVEQWVRRDWLRPLMLTPAKTRRHSPRVAIASADERAPDRDPAAHSARLPHDVFTTIRAALASGPVLIQVPRAGYQLSLHCQRCRAPVHCPDCSGPCQAGRNGILSCGRCGRVHTDWACPECAGRTWRAPMVGAERTAEEIGRAFPQVRVRRSSGERVLDDVTGEPALIVATPGAEPPVTDGTGYAAAILLDTDLLLNRADLRAAEEALRRWLAATALVRPGGDGGTVMAVGDSGDRTLQALVRLDPVGFTERELDEREQAGMPPAVVAATVTGSPEAVRDYSDVLRVELSRSDTGPATTPPVNELVQWLGPVDQAAVEPRVRTVLLADQQARHPVVAALKSAAAIRSARKDEGPVRIVVDPRHFG